MLSLSHVSSISVKLINCNQFSAATNFPVPEKMHQTLIFPRGKYKNPTQLWTTTGETKFPHVLIALNAQNLNALNIVLIIQKRSTITEQRKEWKWSPGLGKDSGRFETCWPNRQIFFIPKGPPLTELTFLIFVVELYKVAWNWKFRREIPSD